MKLLIRMDILQIKGNFNSFLKFMNINNYLIRNYMGSLEDIMNSLRDFLKYYPKLDIL